MPLLLLGFSIEEIFRFWFLVGVLGVQVKLGFFVLQIIFDTVRHNNFSAHGGQSDTTLPPQHPAVFNHANRRHHEELSQPPIQSWTAKAASNHLPLLAESS